MAKKKRSKPVAIKKMLWVILATFVSWILVISPLVFSFLKVYKSSQIFHLFGYAPHQFLFSILFFPFASLSTFISLYILISSLRPLLRDDYPLKFLFDDWPASLLFGIILASIISVVVYFSSGWSLDKLYPRYSSMALDAMTRIDDQVNLKFFKEEERLAYREKLIISANNDLKNIKIPSYRDTQKINSWLLSLSPSLRLKILFSPLYQKKLNLLHPEVLSLNVLQLLAALTVAFYTLVIALVCIYTYREFLQVGLKSKELLDATNAIFYSVFFWGFYPVCYNQYRRQIEGYIGSGTTILQDIITSILVVALLIWLRSLEPTDSARQLSIDTIFRYFPLLIIVSTQATSVLSPKIMIQLIGSETKVGIQLILILIGAMISFLPIAHIYPKK
jgi:hypothetical protein